MKTARSARAGGPALDATLYEATMGPLARSGLTNAGRFGPSATTVRRLVALLGAGVRRMGRSLRGESPARRAPPCPRWSSARWWSGGRAWSKTAGHARRYRRRADAADDDYLEALYGHPFDWDGWVGTYVAPYVEPA